MEELKIALKVNDLDNVATIFANDVTDGTVVEMRDKKGTPFALRWILRWRTAR